MAFDMNQFVARAYDTPQSRHVSDHNDVRYLLTVSNANLPSWGEFVDRCALSSDEAAKWKTCNTCRRTWAKLSVLAVANKRGIYSAFFSGYSSPVAAESGISASQDYACVRPAVEHYVDAFMRSSLTNKIVSYAENGTIGVVESGGYQHMHLKCQLSPTENNERDAVVDLNVDRLTRYLAEWSSQTIERILGAYESRGENAPGYHSNIQGLRWFSKAQKRVEGTAGNWRKAIIIDELVAIFSLRSTEVGNSILHIFSSTSNLAICRDVTDIAAFWSLMTERYNPTVYRQKIAESSDESIEAALRKHGLVMEDFERVAPSIDDPTITAMCAWHYSRAPKGGRPSKTKKSCFDGPTDAVKTYTVDEFIKLLLDDKIREVKYKTHYACHPFDIGLPVTQKAKEMTKRLAGWVTTTSPVTCPSINVPALEEITTKAIVYHPGRWMHDGTMTTSERSLVASGIVIEYNTTWNPNCSCLFSEFFDPKYHDIDRHIHTLHNKLRIRFTPKRFRGIYLSTRNGSFACAEVFVIVFVDGHTVRITVR
uniref:Uncharacterized protein n=1 Tax=viral metagenome TaxID=1070528 RepID=A0A6C0LXM2_9ZZZZ